MECVAESALLALLRGERLHRLQVEVVIQVKVVQILPAKEKLEYETYFLKIESCNFSKDLYFILLFKRVSGNHSRGSVTF